MMIITQDSTIQDAHYISQIFPLPMTTTAKQNNVLMSHSEPFPGKQPHLLPVCIFTMRLK